VTPLAVSRCVLFGTRRTVGYWPGLTWKLLWPDLIRVRQPFPDVTESYIPTTPATRHAYYRVYFVTDDDGHISGPPHVIECADEQEAIGKAAQADDDGANLVDHLAGVEDLDVAAATYRAACRRWPKAKITLRQGARVVDKSW
jgi:hypothetical protein